MGVFSCRVAIIVGGLLLTAGCEQIRTPRLQVGDPLVERRAMDIHDPFPLPDAGPTTFTRPRGFQQLREEPRRTREAEAIRRGMLVPATPGGTVPGPTLPPPSSPGAPAPNGSFEDQSARSYPRIVRP